MSAAAPVGVVGPIALVLRRVDRRRVGWSRVVVVGVAGGRSSAWWSWLAEVERPLRWIGTLAALAGGDVGGAVAGEGDGLALRLLLLRPEARLRRSSGLGDRLVVAPREHEHRPIGAERRRASRRATRRRR